MSWIASISRRMRLSPTQSGSGRVGVTIAVAGVALAVIITEITLGVVFGFKHEIRRKLMGFDSQITILPQSGGSVSDYATEYPSESIRLDDALRRSIAIAGSELQPSLTVRQPAILKTDDQFAAIYLVGRDGARGFDFEQEAVDSGQWPDFVTPDVADTSIVISSATASHLGLQVGDRIRAYFFTNGTMRALRFTVAATYATHFGEYDTAVGFASLAALQGVASLDPDCGTAVEITGLSADSPESILAASERLRAALLQDYYTGAITAPLAVTDVVHSGATYFSWLDLLDTNVVVIFVLMLLVAGFTLVSSLFIIVLERVPTIGILRSLGARRADIRRMFTALAMRPVVIGMIVGNILGIGLLVLQSATGIAKLDPSMYYLDRVPVLMRLWPMIALNIGIFITSWLVVLIPAAAAARTDAAVTTRYE